jgi:hypothetical protein
MADSFLPEIDYTARDYLTIKEALLSHVQVFFPNDWNDFVESNLGIVLLELVAWVGDNLSFYTDRVANESFINTIEQRGNMIQLVRLIGYNPRTASAAVLGVQATLDTAQAAATVIPAYTLVTDQGGTAFEALENISIPAGVIDTKDQAVTGEVAVSSVVPATTIAIAAVNTNLTVGSVTVYVTIGGITYPRTFKTDGTVALPFGGSGLLDYSAGTAVLTFSPGNLPDGGSSITLDYQWTQDIKLYQGQTRLDIFGSDGSANQSFTLTETPVLIDPIVSVEPLVPDPARLEVWLGDPGAPFGTGTGTLWTRVDSLLLSGPSDEHYEVQIDEDDRLTLLFGDNNTGLIPPSGIQNISVVYRTGGGLQGNISSGYLNTSATGTSGLLSVTVGLDNYEPGSGGAERESLEEIRINAPKSLAANDTATTEDDYDALSASFNRPGLGSVARAKSRLTPEVNLSCIASHTGYELAVVSSALLDYYLRMPAAPVIMRTSGPSITPTLSYTTGAGTSSTGTPTVPAADLGSFTGTDIDSTLTRFRTDQQDYQDETMFTGDGATTAFGPFLLNPPVFPGSVVVKYTIAGVEHIAVDDGAGSIDGYDISSGSVDYVTGAVSITFTNPPDDTTTVAVDYQTALRLVFTSAPELASTIAVDAETGPSSVTLPSNNVEVYCWAYDTDANLVPPGQALLDNLKAYLDLRRVVGTSVQTLRGFNVEVNVYLEVDYNPAVSQTDTTVRIVAAIGAFFASLANVDAGTDVALAGLYDAIYPLLGVDKIVVQDLGVNMPVGLGDGATGVFQTSDGTPGQSISSGKVPMVSGAGQIKVFRGTTEVGESDASSPVAVLSGSGLIGTGSTIDVTTGEFDLRLSPSPALNEEVRVEFLLDEQSGGAELWNIAIDPWEIAVLGDIYIAGTKVN